MLELPDLGEFWIIDQLSLQGDIGSLGDMKTDIFSSHVVYRAHKACSNQGEHFSHKMDSIPFTSCEVVKSRDIILTRVRIQASAKSHVHSVTDNR